MDNLDSSLPSPSSDRTHQSSSTQTDRAYRAGSSYPRDRGYSSGRRHEAETSHGIGDLSFITLGTAFIGLGAYLIYKGAQGESQAVLPSTGADSGLQVRERVRVHKPVGELYSYWRKLENLPHVMTHLESVTTLGERRSHWVAKGPVGTHPEWDAVITDDRPDESIAWRSTPDSQVRTEGAVAFRKVSENSTDIIVSLTYHPPAGALGAAVANLLGASPAGQISDDLETFKQKAESGELSLNV